MIQHANAAGLIGGFPVCGARTGFVMVREEHTNCPECLRAMVAQGYSLTEQQEEVLRCRTTV